MEHTKELLSIHLSDLVLSHHNVRRHSTTQVEELAALIDAQGLLHNLVVTEQVVGVGKSRKVRFAVAAGERRRRALLLLQQRGQLPKSHEVLCELVPPERALEISVAENSAREAMHPADEFEAFNTMIAEGKGVEDVAARFGVSVLTVQRRLKLASVLPKLLALYREEGVNLDQLMALALTDDHAAQERAWFESKAWDRTPAALRRVLTDGEVEAAGNGLVRFVGVESYEGAGGVVRRDLFDDHQSGYLSDAELLRRLGSKKLDALAVSVRAEGWSWAEARLDLESATLRQFASCNHVLRKPNTDEAATLAELDQRKAELDQQSDAMRSATEWSADEAERIDLEEQDIAARRKAVHEGLRTWSPESMAHAGAIVTISREGDVEIIRGLVREADRKALVAGRKSQRPGAVSEETVAEALASHVNRSKPEHSESLTRRLGAHRTAALQVLVSRNPHVAQAALAMPFVTRVFGDQRGYVTTALQVVPSLPAHALLRAADDLKVSRAWQALEVSKETWRARLPQERGGWFSWLTELPAIELSELLALCAALTLSAMPRQGDVHELHMISAAVGLDMADWWEPTAAGFLSHVSKAQIVQALNEAGTDPSEDGVVDMKKDVLVVKAASRLAGMRWLPAMLRPRSAPER